MPLKSLVKNKQKTPDREQNEFLWHPQEPQIPVLCMFSIVNPAVTVF